MVQQEPQTTDRSCARRTANSTASHLVALRGDEAELYAKHHRPLQRVIARRVDLSPDLIEDACQQAWIKLMRHQPDRSPALFGWLTTVAIREAYRLSSKEQRTISIDAAPTADRNRATALSDRLNSPVNIDHSLEARRALRALAALTPRQRRYATLQIAGVSYADIAAREHVSHTAVNKQLDKARAHLRHAAEHAA